MIYYYILFIIKISLETLMSSYLEIDLVYHIIVVMFLYCAPVHDLLFLPLAVLVPDLLTLTYVPELMFLFIIHYSSS